MAFENEWSNIKRMSSEMSRYQSDLRDLESLYQSLQSQLTTLAPEYDEDGNDVNEGRRASVLSEMASTESRISSVEEQIRMIAQNAGVLARDYSSRSTAYSQQSSNHNQAAAQFQRITNSRFGATTARAGSQAAAQHGNYYNSLSQEMSKLASAAEQIAAGGVATGGPGETVDYGGFNNPGGNSNGTKGAVGTTSAPANKRSLNSYSGDSKRNARTSQDALNNPIFTFLGINNLPTINGQTDFSPVSHATVAGNFSSSDHNGVADAIFAEQNGMSKQDAANYRTQNGLAWIVNSDGTQASLVPASIAKGYSNNTTIKTPAQQLQSSLDKSMSRYTRILGDHSMKEDLKATNPNYAPDDKTSPWNINCQRCVSAYEARRRGYDVEAQPCPYGVDALSIMNHPKGWPSVYKGGKLIDCSANTGALSAIKISEQMEAWGDGARAIVRIRWNKTVDLGGHVFIAEMENGKIKFVDPQNGSTDVSSYFSLTSGRGLYIMRIDNLEFTDNIHLCCKNKR